MQYLVKTISIPIVIAKGYKVTKLVFLIKVFWHDFFTKMHAKKGIHVFFSSTDYIRRYEYDAPMELLI